MSKKFQLKIADPCHENWETMSPDEKGRFCGSCQKQVVDFSEMSDRQIAEFFRKPSTGSVCGRFMTDQLERTIEIPKKRIPWVRYFFQITLPAFLFSMKTNAQRKTPSTVKAATADTLRKRVDQIESRTLGMIARIDDFKSDTVPEPVKLPETIKGEIAVKSDTTVTPPVCEPMMGTVAYVPEYDRRLLTVKIVDEMGQPVADAVIADKMNNDFYYTNEKGLVYVPKKWFSKGNVVAVNAAGCTPLEIKGGNEKYQDGQIIIKVTPEAISEVVVTAISLTRKSKATIGAVTKVSAETITTGLTNKKTADVDDKKLAIYPNPVKAGTGIHLAFNKMAEGYYRCQLTNAAGQEVWKQDIWIDGDARMLTIDVPKLVPGNYFLVLTGKTSTVRITENIIVQ